MRKKMTLSTVAMAAIFSLVGCGGGSDPLTAAAAEVGKAFYIDAAVGGVNYKCGTQEGITGTDGSFSFDEGSGCTFYLGDIQLRTVDKALLKNGEKIIEDDVQIAALLQSLDIDGDASNGITLTPEVVEAMTTELGTNGGDGTLPKTAGELTALVAALQAAVPNYQGQAVSEAEAQTHLDETKTKELLGGRTFYVAYEDVTGDVVEKHVINADASSSAWEYVYGKTGNGTTPITIDGNKVTFEGQAIFTVVDSTDTYINIIPNDSGNVSRLYFSLDDAKATFQGGGSATKIPLTLTMLQGKTFYTTNDRGDGTYDFEEITFLSDTTLSFREVVLNTDGTIGYDNKVTLPYSLDNEGKLLVDFSSSTFTYILLSQDNTTWYMSKNGYTDSPYSYWLLSKPANFPN